MKTIKLVLLTLFINLLLYGCSSNGYSSLGLEALDNPLQEAYTVKTYEVLQLQGDPDNHPGYSYSWKIDGAEKSTDNNFNFITPDTGDYNLELKVISDNDSIVFNSVVSAESPSAPYSPYISQVLDFNPAPGQFINTLPAYEEGDTPEAMIVKAENSIAGENPAGGGLSLGTFGGSVTFKFDHTIINREGTDFKVLGNAFAANQAETETEGNAEPGIIMVAWDKNENGIADDDEWYEIAGSEYDKESTIHNYTITYYRPDPDKDPVPGDAFTSDEEYIRWEDNQGNQGFVPKNTFHQQSYFPEWLDTDKITFTGTKIADNYHDQNGDGSYWVGEMLDYGYADNYPNTDEHSEIDIDWAVDKEGNPVKLPGIDFVKVYTATLQNAGWLGEVSTEILGGVDLKMSEQE